MIPLSLPFLEYLRSDGIILPSDDNYNRTSPDGTDSDVFSDSASTTAEGPDEEPDPSVAWIELHDKIKATIDELDGSVVPKLNWSAPKDATWISTTNSMECQVPNDIYLLLKSSDFITHDLEHAFDDCEDESRIESRTEFNDVQIKLSSENEVENSRSDDQQSPQPLDNALSSPGSTAETFPYCLVLRKTIPAMTTSLEFRCFVSARNLLCICQRDLNHYDFLAALIPKFLPLVQKFFDTSLKDTFPDKNFVFDIYIPQPHTRVWLIDINPWAPRTDPLLFSWLELLEMAEGVQAGIEIENDSEDTETELDINGSEVEFGVIPEFRLVERNDSGAFNFNTSQYSAHKLPRDVVDASVDGEAGIRDFMVRWREIIAAQERQADTEH